MARTYAECLTRYNQGVGLVAVALGTRAPRLAKDYGDVLRVWGSDGIIEIEHFGKVRVSNNGEWEEVWEQPKFDYTSEPGHPSRLEAFYLQTQDFVDSLREGRQPDVVGTDGRAAVEMVQAASLSSMTGSSVRLPLPRSKGGHQFDGATVSRDRIPG